jgi:uncharacterized oxidoreductase
VGSALAWQSSSSRKHKLSSCKAHYERSLLSRAQVQARHTKRKRRKNTIIVTGRDPHKLRELQQALPGVHTYQSDVSDPAAIVSLYQRVTEDFPDLNILINNAGMMRMLSLNGQHGLQDIGREIEINLLGPVRMVEQFLPFLKTKRHAAIINTSSGLAFLPLPSAPIYCASNCTTRLSKCLR